MSIVEGLIVAALVALTSWIYQMGARVSVVEAKTSGIEKWMERIEQKLDHVLDHCLNCQRR